MLYLYGHFLCCKAMSRSNQSKSQLLSLLKPVFIRRGYDGATLAHLADASGLSKATLYHHFPGGKADMLEQLVRLTISELQSACFSHLYGGRAPNERIVRLIQGFVSYTDGGRSDCLLAILSHHQANDDTLTTHHAGIAQQFQDWHGALQQTYIELGYKTKRAQRESRGLVAGLYGALVSARLHNDPEVFMALTNRLLKNYA